MKVCMLTSVHTVWDTRIYHREAQSLAKAGYQVTIIATDVESQQAPVENIDIIGLKRPRLKYARPLNWLPFLKAALSTGADIFHFHDPDLMFVGIFLQLLTQKPVIYDNHDPYVEAIYQREWLPTSLRPVISWLFNFVEKFIANKLAAIIIANEAQQARFPHAVLLRNYPDLKSFEQTFRQNSKRKSDHIVHAGTLTEARGVFELIEIAKLLASKQIRLLVLGPFANKGLETEIKQTVCQLGLQKLVNFEGRVPHNKIISGLMEASVGLIPFRPVANHFMIVPTKLFEYMACALPVVASDLPPIRQYVEEIECGLLVPPENPQAFAEAIEYLLSHPEEAGRMGQNGRRAVLEYYNWEVEKKKLLSLYGELLR